MILLGSRPARREWAGFFTPFPNAAQLRFKKSHAGDYGLSRPFDGSGRAGGGLPADPFICPCVSVK